MAKKQANKVVKKADSKPKHKGQAKGRTEPVKPANGQEKPITGQQAGMPPPESVTARTEQSKKAMLAALQKTLGIVTSACQIADVSRTQFYEWINTDASFKAEVAAVKDMQLDFAESQLLKKIKMDDTASIIFYLKTQGKNRGYVERQEVNAKILSVGMNAIPDKYED